MDVVAAFIFYLAALFGALGLIVLTASQRSHRKR
jgi:hypothetical protein